jgi:Spy/CpxP family protein refolding chaperone
MQRLLILIVPILGLFGQLPPPPTEGMGPDDKDPRAIIEKVRIYLLTEKLDLSSEQAMKFFPRLNELRKIEDVFQKERMEIIAKMEKLVQDKASDKELLKALDSFENLMKTKAENDKKVRDELRELLTPVQQAKFMVFQVKFEQEIRDMIREIRENRPPRPPKD